MPQVKNREQLEAELSDQLWQSWMDWSDTPKPSNLKRDQIELAISESCEKQVKSLILDGYSAVMNQFSPGEYNWKQAAFTGLEVWAISQMFRRWRSIGRAWQARVRQYQQERRVYRREIEEEARRAIDDLLAGTPTADPGIDLDPYGRGYLPWEMVRGSGEPIPHINGRGEVVSTPPRPVVQPHDAAREASDLVTDLNTAAEMRAVRDLYRFTRQRIIGYWTTEADPCHRCAALDGQPQEVWMQVAPNGPKLHKHCRCWLVYRRATSLVA